MLQRYMIAFSILSHLQGAALAQAPENSSLLAYNRERSEQVYYAHLAEVVTSRSQIIGLGLTAISNADHLVTVKLEHYTPSLGQLAARITLAVPTTADSANEEMVLHLEFLFRLTAVDGLYKFTLEEFVLINPPYGNNWEAALQLTDPTLQDALKAHQVTPTTTRGLTLGRVDAVLEKFVLQVVTRLETPLIVAPIN